VNRFPARRSPPAGVRPWCGAGCCRKVPSATAHGTLFSARGATSAAPFSPASPSGFWSWSKRPRSPWLAATRGPKGRVGSPQQI